jgi:NAD(P)H-hydrate epimerase
MVTGSVGMSGAACLAATAALRGGAGLVFAAVPQSIQPIVAGFEPCYMTIGLPCDADGQLSHVPQTQIKELTTGKDAIAIGPGLGTSDHAAELVACLLQHATCPVVLDADGLNIAAEHQLLTAHDKASRLVLTPHPGEFARLSGLSISDINSRREQVAVNFAKQCQAVVVLKGAGTVVTDGEQVFTNTTGNPGMATGGTGDVLTGLLAAQLAQGLSPFDAACLAVHVHGLAGDLAAEQLSQRGMIASDLLTFLPQAWKQLE